MHHGAIGLIERPMKKSEAYQHILALPESQVGEFIAGALVVSPPPSSRHGLAAGTLGMDLGSAFQRGRGGPGGWWILPEPELHLGEDVLVPDQAGWRTNRMPVVPDVAALPSLPIGFARFSLRPRQGWIA